MSTCMPHYVSVIIMHFKMTQNKIFQHCIFSLDIHMYVYANYSNSHGLVYDLYMPDTVNCICRLISCCKLNSIPIFWLTYHHHPL